MAMAFSPVRIEERAQLPLRAGDTVRVHQKIKEGEKTRIQIFEGLVIAVKHGREPGAMFTVRKVASGVGMEKIFPLYSPAIEKIEIIRRAKVRRAKLYYIRRKAAKEIRSKMRKELASRFQVGEKHAAPPSEEPSSTDAESKSE